jgi:PIN domain nuclease of toxin-antitoxin system
LRALLDTHALIWWIAQSSSLSPKARSVIANKRSEIYVSAASAWEIATKVRIGKLSWPPQFGSVRDYLMTQGFHALPVTVDHAERAGQLAIDHRDPFDRMLIAQAQAEDLWIVSNEVVFDASGVRRYW